MPLHTSKLDHIYNYSDAGGRAWGHDIALTAEGRPRVVYTRRVNNRDTFWYAYHNGTKWLSRKIVEAGRRAPVLPLRRRDARPRGPARRLPVAHDRQLEPGRAVVHAGLGAHVDAPPADQRPNGYAIRPVTPRGLGQAANRILYVWGDERTIGFTNYTTRVHALDF